MESFSQDQIVEQHLQALAEEAPMPKATESQAGGHEANKPSAGGAITGERQT